MTDAEMLRSEIKLFMRALLLHCRDGIIADTGADLRDGPPGREPDPHLTALHQWFVHLNDDNQALVRHLVADVTDRVIFSILALLDGVAGGYPIQEVISDFALYLQTYADREMQRQDRPATSVRINIPESEHLRDLYLAILRDRTLVD